jgi:hypothetical protein
MMRRIWASIVTVWATLAIVAGLAWSHPQPTAAATTRPVTVLVRGKNGQLHPVQVLVTSSAARAHATTHTSPAPR